MRRERIGRGQESGDKGERRMRREEGEIEETCREGRKEEEREKRETGEKEGEKRVDN